ncbi:MAG: 2-oxoglutarate dehydrogenase E1 subunit family protein, partial [Aeromicrobium sp.]
MAESSQDTSQPDFGTNQWLVEEMYERYQKDPKSVDANWVTFFEKGQAPSPNGESKAESPSKSAAAAAPAPATEAAAPAAPAEASAPAPAPPTR